jgi:hypothetical protein
MLRILVHRKYELLLLALLQHLFIGVFITNLSLYTRSLWLINIAIVGLVSIGVFREGGRWKKLIRNLLFILVLVLPVSSSFLWDYDAYYELMNLAYVCFFLFIFLEILRFLIKPGYVNADIILAAACGYFLLIEIAVFLFLFCLHQNPGSFTGISYEGHTTIFTDLVYYCSVTFTSIGFGDITAASHTTKLITSIFGITGQFYTVVLLGILISKFTSGQTKQE